MKYRILLSLSLIILCAFSYAQPIRPSLYYPDPMGIRSSALFNWEAITRLIERDQMSLLYDLIDNNPSILSERDHLGRNLLLIAAEHGRLNLMRDLIEIYGMDPHSTDGTQRNMAHLALRGDHFEAVEWITSNYPDLFNRSNVFNQTPNAMRVFLNLHRPAVERYAALIRKMI